MIAVAELISSAYLQTQFELHLRPNGYGGKGSKWAPGVADLVRRFGAGSVLDYGAGQRTLGRALLQIMPSLRVAEYDPAVLEISAAPRFADLLVCTDVLEHIEPDRLDAVLAHIRSLARMAVFFVVATRPSGKTLADGRNAHLILESADWWQARVQAAGFTLQPDPPVSPLAKPSREWVAVVTP